MTGGSIGFVPSIQLQMGFWRRVVRVNAGRSAPLPVAVPGHPGVGADHYPPNHRLTWPWALTTAGRGGGGGGQRLI